MERTTLQKITYCTLTAGILVASQSVLAHTRLQTPEVVEGTKSYNAAAIGHGCESATGSSANLPVIANSVIFPDGTDSIISIKGKVVNGAVVADYIGWGGTLISHIQSKDVFEKSTVEYGRAGFTEHSPVGNHSWKGNLPGDDNVGLVPIRIGGTFINEDSCAKSVTFRVAIADICKITGVSGFNEHTVNLWTPAVGSYFDGQEGTHAYNSPATFKITRDLNPKSPNYHKLPKGCGAGVDVVVDPSAAQLNHDLPIPGVWPKAKHK